MSEYLVLRCVGKGLVGTGGMSQGRPTLCLIECDMSCDSLCRREIKRLLVSATGTKMHELSRYIGTKTRFTHLNWRDNPKLPFFPEDHPAAMGMHDHIAW